MGPERAERMDAAASAQRLGVPYSIHSDAPVTHLAPLFTAWCAVNRLTSSGRVLGEAERISVTDALYAVTIGAAFTLKLDTELGSIECGKRADFAILEDDPLAVDPARLHEVPVWGTVVGGASFRARRSVRGEECASRRRQRSEWRSNSSRRQLKFGQYSRLDWTGAEIEERK